MMPYQINAEVFSSNFSSESRAGTPRANNLISFTKVVTMSHFENKKADLLRVLLGSHPVNSPLSAYPITATETACCPKHHTESVWALTCRASIPDFGDMIVIKQGDKYYLEPFSSVATELAHKEYIGIARKILSVRDAAAITTIAQIVETVSHFVC